MKPVSGTLFAGGKESLRVEDAGHAQGILDSPSSFQVSRTEDVKNWQIFEEFCLERLIQEIRDGTNADLVRKIRSEPSEHQKKRLKLQLPAFCPSGVRCGRAPVQFRSHSGLVVVDVDGIRSEEAESLREKAKEYAEVVAAFISPSGTGVKLFWAHSGGEEGHNQAWRAACDRLTQDRVPSQKIDDNHDIGRDCFLSWDDGAFYREPLAVLWVPPIDAIEATDPTDTIDEGGVAEAIRKLQGQQNPERKRDQQAARSELDTEPEHIGKFYKNYVSTRIEPMQGTRNTSTTAMVTFLYRAVSEEVLTRLACYYYRLNQTLFVETLQEHLTDVDNILRGVQQSWLGGLNEAERQVHEVLNEEQRIAFRICRDLGTEQELFYMGEMQLAGRLSLNPKRETGRIILRDFQELEFLKKECPGKSWKQSKEAGEPRRATSWSWNHKMFGTQVKEQKSED